MNILVTGSNGQLGNEMRLGTSLHDDHQYFLTDITAEDESLRLDITDKQAVAAFMEQHAIDLIVNCAAYTNVDGAEADEATARLINCEAVRILGEAAAARGARMIHVSTDYVFDGTACIPYSEEDPVAPATAYGRTKLEGELALLKVLPDAVIIRTAWLYSPFGNNFVKTMIRLGKERDTLNVVFDQVGSPTYARDLAVAIYAVLESKDWHAGIYHFTNEGVCSWFDFTREIHSLYNSQEVLRAYNRGDMQAAQQVVIRCDVHPILSSEYPAKTPRPHYSVLNKKKIRDTFGLEIPYWRDSLAQCIARL
ncbi:MAG: dTDP-4-dehydrorhamnose reductase [Paludibacteraceae bacterium]|nr:dTDP-4-dehydrorhamnose reductase [Paludibacteraceae bacterium]